MMSLGDPEGHPYSTVEGNLKMVYFRLADGNEIRGLQPSLPIVIHQMKGQEFGFAFANRRQLHSRNGSFQRAVAGTEA